MAKCPKCGHRLTVFNPSQFCPKCGVNIRFYGFEENFYREAKYAELSNAGIIAKIRRLRAAFLANNLTKARLGVMILPILGLLLPAGNINLNLILRQTSSQLSGLGLFNMFQDGSLMYILGMGGADYSGKAFTVATLAIVLFVLVALLAVFVLLTSVLCFISVKNMQKITAILAGIGAAASIGIEVFLLAFKTGNAIVDVSGGFGLFVEAFLFCAPLAVNALLWKKGIPVQYDEGMLERVEIFKKYKKGEITLDELPQPVVETEETRKIAAEIEKERNALLAKFGEEVQAE